MVTQTRPGPPTTSAAENEVVDLCRELIAIDTSNYGDDPRSGERPAAEYVAEKLSDVGVAVELVESSPGRTSVFARVAGQDATRPALMLHGHLDVVPADASDWQLPPFAGEIAEDDGVPMVWGRGAIDMKDMDAMILSVVRDRVRTDDSRLGTWCWRFSRTRRQAARWGRTGWSNTVPTCSRALTRQWEKSAASASP